MTQSILLIPGRELKREKRPCNILSGLWQGQSDWQSVPTGRALTGTLVLILNSPTLNIASKPKRSKYEHKLLNQCILEQTLNIAGKPKRSKHRFKHEKVQMNAYLF